MKKLHVASALVAAGVLLASPVFAQTAPDHSRQMAQADSKAKKQRTQGELPTVGPASGAYKQGTQGELPTVGPASGAYKQRTQGALPTVGPASGAYNQTGTR